MQAATALAVSVQSANANEARQIAQLENLIAEGVDALVIVPFNSKVLSNVIAKARKSGIKVIAYDRLILGARWTPMSRSSRSAKCRRRAWSTWCPRAITTCWAAPPPTTTRACSAKDR